MDAAIIIVGAGPAGLLAAYELSTHGHDILILEARDRIGGRAHTIRDDAGRQMEAGAEFVHGDLPITRAILKEAALSVTETGGRWVIVEGGTTTEDLGTDDWPELMSKLSTLKEDMTLQDFLEEYFPENRYAALKDRAISYAEGYDSADASRVSAKALCEEWSKREEDEYRIDLGYSSLMDYLAAKCRDAGCRILHSQIVSAVSTPDHEVIIQTQDATYTADKVIIALPLGVLQQEKVFFPAAASAHISALNSLGIGDVIKFLFHFREPFWEVEYPGLGFLLGRSEIPTWWTQAPTQSPLLTGWMGGRIAKAHKHLPDQQLLEAALDSLAELFSCNKELLRKEVLDMQVYNWSSDPYALGSYAYTTVGAGAAQKVLAAPIDGRIFFTGEYMFEGPEMGTVEAAFHSGKQTAQSLIEGNEP